MKPFLLFLFSIIVSITQAQTTGDRIKLFLDCNAYCDINYLKMEINLVDFTPDNKAADVHLLITQQGTGGGGNQYQLIFYGQNRFRNLIDTLQFRTEPNNTDFENRQLLLKYIQYGLAPFIAKTDVAKYGTISFKQSDESRQAAPLAATNDKWNYWVFNVGVNGYLNGDQIYKGVNYDGRVTASRITDKIKVSFRVNGNKNENAFTFDDPSGGKVEIVNKNHNYTFYHQVVKSINQHWSYGYDVDVTQSTFSNYKLKAVFNPAIEYNIFPYKESNNKLLTLRYGLTVRQNNYFDTTIFRKTEEALFGQSANVYLSFTQKWGNSFVGINYHNFLNNFKQFNLGMNGYINVRITGGLSFNIFAFAGLVRDQIYLSGEGASERDVLIRRRQLASSYNYYTSFGINYRFGSKVNNFVNPRFEGGGNNFFFFN